MDKNNIAVGLSVGALLIILFLWKAFQPTTIRLSDWNGGFARCAEDTAHSPKELTRLGSGDYGYQWASNGIYLFVYKESIEDTAKIENLYNSARKRCN